MYLNVSLALIKCHNNIEGDMGGIVLIRSWDKHTYKHSKFLYLPITAHCDGRQNV